MLHKVKPVLAMSESDKRRFYSKIQPSTTTDCHLWTAAKDTSGYGLFRVGPWQSMVHAHRIAYMLHHNVELPDSRSGDSKTCVLHTCDVRTCCNPAHLWLGSRDDNTKDCARKGRIVTNPDNKPPRFTGEQHWHAKIAEADVRYIRQYAQDHGLTKQVKTRLASRFNLSVETIWDIVRRRSWKHI